MTEEKHTQQENMLDDGQPVIAAIYPKSTSEIIISKGSVSPYCA